RLPTVPDDRHALFHEHRPYRVTDAWSAQKALTDQQKSDCPAIMAPAGLRPFRWQFLQHKTNQCDARRQPEPPINVVQVRGDRARAQVELLRDLRETVLSDLGLSSS